MTWKKFLQQQKINWHLFKTQNFKLAKLNKFTLNRVDLCYSKTKKEIDTIQSFEFFLNSCHEKILQNSRTKHIKYSRNKKGFILKVGSRKSPSYYRVYENNQEIRFELEMKSSRVQSVQDFLFSHQIPEFEQRLTKHFYNYSTKILVLDQVYTDWLIQYLRRKEKQDAGLLLPFFKQNTLSVSDNILFSILLNFITILLIICLVLEDFSKSSFQSIFVFPYLKVTRKKAWTVELAISEKVYFYRYPFYFPELS